jgi:hypothetical protein
METTTRRRGFVGAATALTLLGGFAAAGCATPARTAVGIGVPVTAGGWQYTVLEVRRTKTMQAGFMTATAKGEYVVVALELVNRRRENGGLRAWDFDLVDATGVRYGAAENAWAWSQGIPGKLLGAVGSDTRQRPGGRTYAIAFDVAPDATGLQLRAGTGARSSPCVTQARD